MNEQHMRDYYATYNTEDAEALAAFYADNVEFTSMAGTTVGPDAILESYRYLTSVFHDKMTPEQIDIDGDTAQVLITDRFEAKTEVPDFFGQSFAPGDTLELKLKGTYTARDGKFTRVVIEPAS